MAKGGRIRGQRTINVPLEDTVSVATTATTLILGTRDSVITSDANGMLIES